MKFSFHVFCHGLVQRPFRLLVAKCGGRFFSRHLDLHSHEKICVCLLVCSDYDVLERSIRRRLSRINILRYILRIIRISQRLSLPVHLINPLLLKLVNLGPVQFDRTRRELFFHFEGLFDPPISVLFVLFLGSFFGGFCSH